MSLIRILMKVKVMMILNNLQREVVRRLKMALNRDGTRFTSFTFHCHLQDHDPHEHGLDDHDTPRLIWQVDQLLPLTSDTDHQFYM